MMMHKTYRRDDDGTLHYREAWKDKGFVVTHTGKVGTKGKQQARSVKSKTWPNNPTATEQLAQFLAQATADGYRELADDEMGWAVLQIWTEPDGPLAEWVLAEGTGELNEKLGWLGLGHYDGYDIGGTPPTESGLEGTRINLFCRVVDCKLGVKALRAFGREHDLIQRTLIAAREPGAQHEYALAWAPTKKIKNFTF
ncbi:hypothetical protein [Glutamicibacter sp. PS]|uniref:hypothetical protein n=1 Tax=Glutamicibacter sp. PS TaxID=3075634 RepID=UPI002847B94F|nr:hypothetical protein [Glutamicibacter sp. PS]MDR4533080.1 hypothetical protein [Glutamicibacter sp. PS]